IVNESEKMVAVVFEIPEALLEEWEVKAAFRRVSVEEVVFGKKARGVRQSLMTVRVPFVYSDYVKLKDLSEKIGFSLSITLAKAIRLLMIYIEVKQAGGEIFSKHKRFLRRNKIHEIDL